MAHSSSLQVRKWDAETLVNTATWNSNKAIYCIAAAAASPSLVAFGGADSAWRLWDSRQDRKQELVSEEPLLEPLPIA